MVLLEVESDAACTSLNGHYARKCAVLVLICAMKPQVLESKMCEGTDCLKATLSSGVTSLQLMVACKKCGLGEQ